MILISEKGLAGKTTLLKQHLLKSNFNDTLSIFLHAPFQDRVMKSQITALNALNNDGAEHSEYLTPSLGQISRFCDAESFSTCEDGKMKMLHRKFRVLTFETLSKNFINHDTAKFGIDLDGKVFGSKSNDEFNVFLTKMFSNRVKNEGSAVELIYAFDGEVYFPTTNNIPKIKTMIGPKNSYQIYALYQRNGRIDSFISAIFYDESSGINFSVFNVKSFRNGIDCIEGTYLSHIPESDSIDHLPEDKREKKFLFSLYNIRGATIDNINAMLFPALSSGNTFKGGKFSSDALSFIVYLSKRAINFVASDDYLKNVVEIDNMSSIHNVRTKLVNEYQGTDNITDIYKDRIMSSWTVYGLHNLIDSIITDDYARDELTTIRGNLTLLNSIEKVVKGEYTGDQESSEKEDINDSGQKKELTKGNDPIEDQKLAKSDDKKEEEKEGENADSSKDSLKAVYIKLEEMQHKFRIKNFSTFEGNADAYIFPFISWSSYRFIPNTTLPSEYRINQYVDFMLLPLTASVGDSFRLEGFFSISKMKFDHNNMVYFLHIHTTKIDETVIICAQNEKKIVDPVHYLTDKIREQICEIVKKVCKDRYDYLEKTINYLFAIRTVRANSTGDLIFRELDQRGMTSNSVYRLSDYSSEKLGQLIGGLEFDSYNAEIRSKYLS